MKQQARPIGVLAVWMALVGGIPLYAQDHSQHQAGPATPTRGGPSTMTGSQSIF